MRTLSLLVSGVGVALTASLLVQPPASAAADVTIRKIANTKVAYGKKATVKPRVTKSARTSIASKVITVKKGKKTVVRKRTSARLKPGTYSVTTAVRYKTYSDRRVSSTARQRVVTVPAWSNTPVTCAASEVGPVVVDQPLTFTATCRGTAFDGAVTVYATALNGAVNGWTSHGLTAAAPAGGIQNGTSFSGTLTAGTDLYGMRSVTTTKTVRTWSRYKTKKLTQKLTIREGKRPTRTSPNDYGECPGWAPIKGNGDSMIYHVPGGRWYDVTNAEECFATESAARNAGYRASRNG